MGKNDRAGAMSFQDACQYLTQNLGAAGRRLFVAGQGMERSREFFARLGDPQETFRSLHIAGTSGKGTVAYMLSALLTAHKRLVGTHTSPHVYDIRERCMIDGRLIAPERFAAAVQRLVPIIESMRRTPLGAPTYFEATVGLAFDLFSDEEVDYAVVETGLGGLYDSTNTIRRGDKLAIINALGYDHTEVLGKTMAEIAAQKAGILPIGGHGIVLDPSAAAARRAIDRTATERATTIEYVVPESFVRNFKGLTFDYTSDGLRIPGIRPSTPGRYQINNAVMALRCLEYIANRDGFVLEPAAARRALEKLQIPGRFERIRLFDRRIIFDGAHNPQKLAALTDSLAGSQIDSAVWVMALKNDKDAAAIMKIVAPYVDQIVFTKFFSSQTGQLGNWSMAGADLAAFARRAGIARVSVVEDNMSALQQAARAASDDQPVVVAGSFYLLGEIRAGLQTRGLV